MTILYLSTISVPLPSHRLASAAVRSLEVDVELSQFVKRSIRVSESSISTSTLAPNGIGVNGESGKEDTDSDPPAILLTEYRATTNRMLRVAVNGFMESLGVVLGVMEELDVDVLVRELGEQVVAE